MELQKLVWFIEHKTIQVLLLNGFKTIEEVKSYDFNKNHKRLKRVGKRTLEEINKLKEWWV